MQFLRLRVRVKFSCVCDESAVTCARCDGMPVTRRLPRDAHNYINARARESEPVVPFGMGDDMVGFFVAAGIIHQDHAGDGDTAKNVDANEARGVISVTASRFSFGAGEASDSVADIVWVTID
jgi:hypothetical protein